MEEDGYRGLGFLSIIHWIVINMLKMFYLSSILTIRPNLPTAPIPTIFSKGFLPYSLYLLLLKKSTFVGTVIT